MNVRVKSLSNVAPRISTCLLFTWLICVGVHAPRLNNFPLTVLSDFSSARMEKNPLGCDSEKRGWIYVHRYGERSASSLQIHQLGITKWPYAK